eukprot:TRINITY_DN4836_c0_g2_i2.p1 TRINITY_DN4836_c0_g2~~TRINITY_DN4836_c0_g2_i2.p1  ORF type:complete len:558 (-),score=206.92 TRINITY_DN4836_c0_g2_i2:63-1736(-)
MTVGNQSNRSSVESLVANVEEIFAVIYRGLKEVIAPIVTDLTQGFDTTDVLVTWTVIIFAGLYLRRFYVFMKYRDGWAILKSRFWKGVMRLPPVRSQLDKDIGKMMKSLDKEINVFSDKKSYKLPDHGMRIDRLRERLDEWVKRDDKIISTGKLSGSVYYQKNPTHELCKDYAREYVYANLLHFDLFPSARQMEVEIIAMTINLFRGEKDVTCGVLTTGGTESILLAVLTYRQMAYERGIEFPEILLPETAHAAFDKAAFYFNVKLTKIPINKKTFEVDPEDFRNAITCNTIAIVGSFPNYPHGIHDPVEELATIAQQNDLGFHCDACLGGFLLPFAEEFDRDLGIFDFRHPGITSLSVDPHKYGLGPKGVSVLMFKNKDVRRHIYFKTTTWPGGFYATAVMGGSRSGASIAGCWAAMMNIGLAGYKDQAEKIFKGMDIICEGLKAIPEVEVCGDPKICAVALRSAVRRLDTYLLSTAIKKRGWAVCVCQNPPCVHWGLTLANADRAHEFVKDVKASVEEALAGGMKIHGVSQMYGSSASLPENFKNEGMDLSLIHI